MGPVAITGIGAVSPLGWGWKRLWEGVRIGRDGIADVKRYALDGFSVTKGGLVPDRNHPMPPEAVRSLCLEFAVEAAAEAVREAFLAEAELPTDRIGLCLGTSLGDTTGKVHRLAEDLGDRLEIHGPRLTVSTACASSANAIGLGKDLLEMGSVDVVLAGGADLLSASVFAGFYALGVLSQTKCAPFGLPLGTTLAEGAGFFLMESPDHAEARGAGAFGFLTGYGLSSDGYHETSPDPKGRGLARAIWAALAAAAVEPQEIGYLNAHGSGTEANDRAEWLAVQSVFGKKARSLPVSSTKGHIGHAQGAAGILEAIVTLLSLQEGVIPPTLRCDTRRPFGPVDPVEGNRPRKCQYEHSLSSSSAFGGANCVVALSRSKPPKVSERPRTSILAIGTGVIGPTDNYDDGVDRWLDGEELTPGPVADYDIRSYVPMANPREMDDLGRHLTASTALAFRDAGARVHGPIRDRVGLVVGTTTVSAEEGRTFQKSIDERGLARCSATAFARMVLNAAAGTCTKELSLRGPTSTITTGAGSGLMAIIYACQILASRADVDLLVGGGIDAQGLGGTLQGNRSDGAATLLIARSSGLHGSSSYPERKPTVEVAGWGIAGPGYGEKAAEAALGGSGKTLSDIDLLVGSSTGRPTPPALHSAFSSAWVVSAAFLAIRSGRVRSALVLCDEGASASGALYLRNCGGEDGH